jgi:MoaA/NifB/PqqE/SkfB family radical SAM enzyme
LQGDPVADLAPERRPGSRMWLYTNFHCNLACDYCCVSSSPRAPRRLLDLQTIDRLAQEAVGAGVVDIFLTGGEPFLRSDIAEVIGRCADARPTTVLTNGMLFSGKRLQWLEACPRQNVTLQISLDSAEADLHDLHRGAGSHRSAVAGIEVARELGFRTRVAATVETTAREDEDRFQQLCDELGIAVEDRVLRRIARQGEADDGVAISRRSVIPEVCVTDQGVWWHPVGATDPSLQVFDRIPPLAEIIRTVTDEFVTYRLETELVAASFPCA